MEKIWGQAVYAFMNLVVGILERMLGIIVCSLVFFFFNCNIGYAKPFPSRWSQLNLEDFESGVINSDSFHGNRSVFIKSRNVAKPEKGLIFQSVTPFEFLGKRVRLSAYLKSIGVRESSGLFMQLHNNGRIIADDMKSRYVKGDTDWNLYEVILDVPYETVYLSFGAWLKGKGEIRVDNFNLKIVDTDFEVTSDQEYKPTITRPLNLDFEITTKSNMLPKPWYATNCNDFDSGITRSDTFRGKFSAYLSGRKSNSIGSIGQNISAPNYWIGKTIESKAYLKTTDVKMYALMYMDAYKESGYVLRGEMINEYITGNTEWEAHTITLEVPIDVIQIKFGVKLYGLGEIRADNFSFKIIERRKTPAGKLIFRKYDTPKNLDFEE